MNRAAARKTLGQRLRSNPVAVHELRQRMRGGRVVWVLTLYLFLLSAGLTLMYFILASGSSTAATAEQRQVFGKTIFGVTAWLELLTICLAAPGLTSGSISAERERQTLDLLRVSLLPPRSLVLGKFGPAVLFLLLLLLAALPLQSLAFFFGGITLQEVLGATLILVVSAVAFCAVGVFCSSFSTRTRLATILSYAFAIFILFGLPLLILAGFIVLNVSGADPFSQPSPGLETLLLAVGWLLVSLNPLAAAIASEAILLENGSLFSIQVPLSAGNQVTLVSPWISFTVLFLGITAILLLASIYLVGREER